MKSITVVTTILNEKETIKDLIAGLVLQSREPDEIIIVDGGSRDGTIELVRSLTEQHPKVRLIVSPGSNIAAGRNIGVKNAKHSIIAVIDAGCKPDKDWLREILRPFEENPDLDVVAGVTKVESHSPFEMYSGALLTAGAKEPDAKQFRVSGRSAAFAKEIWAKAGGYPEWLYTGEDTLYDAKLRLIGARIGLARSSIVHWRPRKTLWKTAKMYYLYGKGNGRIGVDARGAFYHLRNYLAGFVLLALSVFYPVVLLPLVLGGLYYYGSFFRPIVRRTKEAYPGWRAEMYVPLIVFARTLSYYLGLVAGHWELERKSGFKDKLATYMGKESRWAIP